MDRPSKPRAAATTTATPTPAPDAPPSAAADASPTPSTHRPAASGPRHAPPAEAAPVDATHASLAPPEPEPLPLDDGSVDPDDEGRQGSTGGWDDGLAQTILKLVRQTDPAIEAWTISVPLDARVLPDSVLELAYSRQRLSLRFVTQSPVAHHLLLTHRAALASKLRSGLNRSRDIDIEVI